MRSMQFQIHRGWRVGVGALATVALGLCTGCISPGLPCLQYTPQSVVRAVHMRGYGTVEFVEESMVCTRRAASEKEAW
jgi:hypothetical protein